MNLVATHYNCTSPMDYISHHALHSHIPIHHYTNHTAVTIHSLALIVSPHLIHTHTFKQHSHMHSPRSLVFPGWHSERFPCILFPCVYLDCLYDSDHLLPAFLTLPALWYPLCLPPAPTFALSLLLILPCLRDTCYCLWPLPVWPCLVVQ